MNSKVSKVCGQEKDISEFWKNCKYFYSHCKKCMSDARKIYYQDNKEKYQDYHKKQMQSPEFRKKKSLATKVWRKENPGCRTTHWLNKLAKKFGYTKEAFLSLYDRLFETQNGECPICGTKLISRDKGTCVDHNHFNMQVRGLLCKKCNFAIGLLKDSASNCFRAADYLRN